MKSFSQYIVEETKEVVFTFGRFNPPTNGHEKLISKVASLAKGNSYRVYASKSQDAKKNPLDFNNKIKYMRKMFPKYGRNIMGDKDIRNALDILVKLYDQGFGKVTMVVGSDRVSTFEALTNKYNGVSARHGMYNFEGGVSVVSAGERDPDADDISGMSASKMRTAASNNDYATFAKGLPSKFKDGKGLFSDIRKAMGIKEASEFKNHVQLEPVSKVREEYIKTKPYEVDEEVRVIPRNTTGNIKALGTNYLVIESFGEVEKYWLDQVEKIDEDLKKAYGKGLAKSTNAKRQAQFNKQAKMDDDDPDAYKPAPGDKEAKTKPSKHTKKFKDMFGESSEKGLKAKAEKSGMPYSILKQVYNRGVAAWKTGHRPGTTPQQWGYARVNSFATKSKGTWGGADKDLAAKVRG